ncbi:MAG: LacI family transcriptional regulator [Opitutaceae bacterium]|nr:LacI family transcriptional regulator [Opitutaceae bacterium]
MGESANGSLAQRQGGRIVPPMERNPTLGDIANKAGVSRFTVSLALRNSPRVAEETRNKVRQVAQDMGYRPNPTLAALMRSIRSKTRGERGTSLALIVAIDQPQWQGRHHYLFELRRGAQERADLLGYGFEMITLPKAKDPGRRLQQIIEARGIDGLIIAPFPHLGFRLDLDFSRLAYVSIGHTLTEVPANRIEAATYHNMRTVLDATLERGWKRPGAVIHHRLNAAVENRLLGAYLAYGQEREGSNTVPPLLCDERDLTPERVLAWVKKHRVDAVIGGRGVIVDWLNEAGLRVGRDIGFAHLDCAPYSTTLAGMDQRLAEVGGTAVEMLGEQIQANMRGIPRIPKMVEIYGVWHDGPTMPMKVAR